MQPFIQRLVWKVNIYIGTKVSCNLYTLKIEAWSLIQIIHNRLIINKNMKSVALSVSLACAFVPFGYL